MPMKKVGRKFRYGEIKGKKTTPKQEKFLHLKHIPHGHITCKKCGRRYCKCKKEGIYE